MEYIPIVDASGTPRTFVAIVNDVVKMVSQSRIRWWFWISDIAVDVTNSVDKGILRIGQVSIDLRKLFDDKPWLFVRTVKSIDHYVEFVKDSCASLRGAKVSEAFSGGKDSTVALAALMKLSTLIGFDVDVVYVHMPFIEPERNVSEALRIARVLGTDVTVVEPPRKEVLRELRRGGMPKRGCRICTYFKVAPIRFRARAMGIDVQAYGDRIWEAGKRFDRLFFRFFVEKRLVSKHLGFTVIAPLSIVDVVEQCRSLGTIHYMYLRGAHRVSCVYCPQKPVFELVGSGLDVEDPGVVDEVIKDEWKRRYERMGIDFESFREYHLWRFTPSVAKTMFLAKKHLEKVVDGSGVETMKARDFLEQLKSPWLYGVKAPFVDIEKVYEVFRSLALKIVKSVKGNALARRESF